MSKKIVKTTHSILKNNKRILLVFIVIGLIVNTLYIKGFSKPTGIADSQFVFEDPTYSFEFLRTMSYSAYKGADMGECYSTALRIKNKDSESWYTEWTKTADQVKSYADQAAREKNYVGAKNAYLRASNYYRTADFFLPKNEGDDRIYESWNNSKECFVEAGKLFTTESIEAIQIPYENTTLPGYLFMPDKSGKPRPTLIVMTGFDGTAEEMYFQIGAAALERGYNVLAFDGPGQGGALREKNLYFRPDWENVVTPVVDYLVKRPEVMKEKIGLLGYSFGGYLAPRAVTKEFRIAACVANSGIYSFFDSAMGDMIENKFFLEEFNKEDSKMINLINKIGMDLSVEFRWKMDDGMWKFNAKTLHQLLKSYEAYTLEGLVQNIKCPVLVCDTENEAKFGNQGKILFEKLKCPKDYLEFAKENGSDAHCQYGANHYANQCILDWLDKQLK